MTPSKYKALVDKIVEANPEIMALVPGCKVRLSDNTIAIYNGRNDIDDENYFIRHDEVGCEDEQFLTEGQMKYKILGRDITLEDVMIAIDTHCPDYFKEYSEEVLENWIWGNKFEEQKAVIKFLYEVIVKK